jgi:hypothetical protein
MWFENLRAAGRAAFVLQKPSWSPAAIRRLHVCNSEAPDAVYRIAMPGYFETIRLPLLSGRPISDSDDSKAAGAVVINERAAHEYWPGQSPIGQRIVIGGKIGQRPDWLTMIGVVANARQEDWAQEPFPEIYLAALQNDDFMGLGGRQPTRITLLWCCRSDCSAPSR